MPPLASASSYFPRTFSSSHFEKPRAKDVRDEIRFSSRLQIILLEAVLNPDVCIVIFISTQRPPENRVQKAKHVNGRSSCTTSVQTSKAATTRSVCADTVKNEFPPSLAFANRGTAQSPLLCDGWIETETTTEDVVTGREKGGRRVSPIKKSRHARIAAAPDKHWPIQKALLPLDRRRSKARTSRGCSTVRGSRQNNPRRL